MDNIEEIDISLMKFEGIVRELLMPCSLDEAFNAAQRANIASMMQGLFYETKNSSRKIPVRQAEEYLRLVNACLGEFDRMRHGSNGHALDFELCREQMDGRKDLIRRLMEQYDSDSGYN